MEPNRSPMMAVTRIMLCTRKSRGDVCLGTGGTAWNGSPAGFKWIDASVQAQLQKPTVSWHDCSDDVNQRIPQGAPNAVFDLGSSQVDSPV